MLRLSAALICGVLTVGAAAPPNTVLLRDWSGKRGGGSQPVTISRVFAEGDIPHFAQARVNGAPVLTQCDVKTRWKDGSVQHAILSFVAPARNSSVDFLDQETGNEQDFF